MFPAKAQRTLRKTLCSLCFFGKSYLFFVPKLRKCVLLVLSVVEVLVNLRSFKTPPILQTIFNHFNFFHNQFSFAFQFDNFLFHIFYQFVGF